MSRPRGLGKSGGRKKGSRNKIKAPTVSEQVQAAVQQNKTPLEVMLDVTNGSKAYTPLQIDAAKAAAPYVHARKVEQQNTHVFTQFGERLDQMNRRDKDYKHGED